LALASAAPALLEAEEHARECAARLAAWGVSLPDQIVWQVGGPLTPRRDIFCRALAVLDFLATDWTVSPLSMAFYTRCGQAPLWKRYFYELAESHVRHDERWKARAADGERLPAMYEPAVGKGLAVPASLVGRSFADVPNPFAPLVEIWRLGFVPEGIGDGPLVLYAPAL
jgi:hypothetical protein